VRVKRVRLVKVVLPPHVVSSASRHVRFGGSVTVNGWLGTSDGTALPGQSITLLAAPDDGRGLFQPVTVVVTGADGSWTASLRPGPSRLIEAQYGGDATEESTASGEVKTVVPARVRLNIRPRQAQWGGKIRITGRLLGGYVPSGGELIVLWIGWPGGSTEIGHLYAGSDGRFSSTYTFLRGNGTETYKLWATTARESSYPFTPSRSRAVPVTVRPR
jgi:hypothetical protein